MTYMLKNTVITHHSVVSVAPWCLNECCADESRSSSLTLTLILDQIYAF